MKLHKLISRTVLATALLGTTFGGAFSLNASADSTGPIGAPSSSGTPAGSSRQSSLQVNNGLLTLDNVPTLDFSNSNDNQSNVIQLNTSSNTSPNARLLEVTDYRKNSQANDWELTADMSPLTDNNSNNQKINTQWEIDLFNTKPGVYNNVDQKNAPNIQDNTTLLSNNSTPQSVMSKNTSKGDDNGYGVNQLNYNDSNDARLITPNVAPSTYTTNINWHLTTGVPATNNVGTKQ